MIAHVDGVSAEGIIQLRVRLPELRINVPDQAPVLAHHITLVRLDDLGLDGNGAAPLPPPPPAVELDGVVRLVDTGLKRSCYINCSEEWQAELVDYVRLCLRARGLPETALDPRRVFHVTLTNAGGGDPRASVGAPWEFDHTVV